MSFVGRDFSGSEIKFRLSKLDSIVTDADVRRGDISDIENIVKLVTRFTFELFGDIDVAEIVDKSLMTMCLENSDDEVVAALSLADYPNIPSIPPWEWTTWLYNIYQLESITPRNTFWIHLALWDPRYTYTFMRAILTAVFSTSNMIEYILIVIPPKLTNTSWLKGLGTRIIPSGFSEPNKVQTLYLMVRQHFVKRYKIRRAVEEDNDDLVPLIHSNSERLVQSYGEFYIAEILTRHPDAGRQLIVAEYAEHAVAVLCLNEAVNVEVLTNAFELAPFYALRKPHEVDDYLEICGRISAMTLLPDDYHDEPDLSPIEMVKPEDESDVKSIEMEELDLEHIEGEDSEDDISLVGVSSIHLLFTNGDEQCSIDNRSESDYSAMILSFNDYEMHLFADKSGLKSFSFNDVEYLSNKQIKSHSGIDNNLLYHGEINAFTLELAVSHMDYELEALPLLLEAAFECYPDLDYCVLTVPSTCPYTPIFRNFVKVPPKPYSAYPQELYVLHRNAMLSKISVRLATRLDMNEIEELVTTIDSTEMFMEVFQEAINENGELQAYVMLSESQIVGVATTSVENDFEYLKNNYELRFWFNENYHKSGSHGSLEYFVLSPIFQRHARFFLREIHRLNDYSVLYYRIHPSDANSITRFRSLCCGLSDLVSANPRFKPEMTQTNLEDCAPKNYLYEDREPFALYISTPRLGTILRHEINRKLVVVGSSDTALSFLFGLLCTPTYNYRVTFTNVTVVSPHGLNYQKSGNVARDMMFVTQTDFCYNTMYLYSLKTYVNIVHGVMTGIDRKNKVVIVNNYSYLNYDYLFLLCGEQFQKPNFPNAPKDKHQKEQPTFPGNVFLINTEIDATNSLMKLKDIIQATTPTSHHKYQVIVYGNALEAYCCLAALLEFGVTGKHLTFVESFPVQTPNKHEHTVSFFNDGDVDEAVQSAIRSEDITVYSSYYFTDWKMDENSNNIVSATFQARCKEITLKCCAMFMYNNKTVSARTFLAVNQAGMVFDGSLVIAPDCRTNDPNIYAAGTITKYSRRYYADHLVHRHFNLDEIGNKLAQNIRKKLTPFACYEVEQETFQCKSENMLVPVYEKPLITYCRLPGNLKYLSITKPGLQVPLEVAMTADDYGQVLVTGDIKLLDKQGYFRLHLNIRGVVETITCLAKFNIDRTNLSRVWGKHEKLLNNLLMRFEMLMITDLFDYFREPWTCAIYHDRFSSFEKKLKEIMTSFSIVPGNSVMEDLVTMYKKIDYAKLALEQAEEVEEKFLGSTYHQKIESNLLEFIRENESFLSMYAHPSLVRYILREHEDSPLFYPQ